MRNALLWMVTLEAAVVLALSMLIAVFCEGWKILAWLGVCDVCALWIALFFHMNAPVFGRRIRATAKKLKKMVRRAATRPTRSRKHLTIVTFPVDRVSHQMSEVKSI